ncbi:MAG: hypothetical protein HQL22_12520 [Candidatus Omnitrophica bacterium]|nr:hypothetical protein [Candidatus Omnitrophota bacterium]
MIKRRAYKNAFAFLEYLVLIVVIVSAFIAFRFYVQRGYQGQMERSGESFAFGRQYDPNDTMACVYNDKLYVWYAEACAEHQFRAQGCNKSTDYQKCVETIMNSAECTAPCARNTK